MVTISARSCVVIACSFYIYAGVTPLKSACSVVNISTRMLIWSALIRGRRNESMGSCEPTLPIQSLRAHTVLVFTNPSSFIIWLSLIFGDFNNTFKCLREPSVQSGKLPLCYSYAIRKT